MTNPTLRSRVRSPLATLSALLAGLAVIVGLVVAPSGAAAADESTATSYVALGDSYSSGVGSREYYPDSGSCQRSPHAYPVLDAARTGAALTFVACSGATTADVTSSQLSALSSSTGVVTISVGGNDAGFSAVLTECAKPAWASDCDGAIDGAQAIINNDLPGRLDTLYADIRARATAAAVVVVGYPRLFNGEDCNAGTFFGPEEQQRLNGTADLLASVTAAHAAAAGFSFVDPRDSFVGHAVCDNPEWLNGLSSPVSESYHPNRDGQVAYADLVDDYL